MCGFIRQILFLHTASPTTLSGRIVVPLETPVSMSTDSTNKYYVTELTVVSTTIQARLYVDSFLKKKKKWASRVFQSPSLWLKDRFGSFSENLDSEFSVFSKHLFFNYWALKIQGSLLKEENLTSYYIFKPSQIYP